MEVCQELTFQLTLESGHTFILELIQSELNSKICFMYVCSQDHVCANTHTQTYVLVHFHVHIVHMCAVEARDTHLVSLTLQLNLFFFKELIFHWV